MSLQVRLITLLLVGFAVILQGCASMIIAGGATAGAMANDRRTSGAYVDDETIEWKIIDVLYQDEQIDQQTHLNATSFNGIVLLTGEIPDQEMRVKIDEKIKSIRGVRQLHDETSIAAPSSMMSRSGDTWITRPRRANRPADSSQRHEL